MIARRVEQQAARWELRVSGSPFRGGTASLVVPVARADGTAAVLKLIDPTDEALRHEHAALRAFDGDGAVRLLDADPDAGALLLERLEPGAPLKLHPNRHEVIAIVCRLLRRLWRPPPDGHPFVSATDHARRWARVLPETYEAAGRPFERKLLDAAVAACEQLAHPDGPPVIANRDLHLENVLSAAREPWLLIDPQPVAGERAFDLAYLAQDLVPEHPSAADLDAILDRLAGELELSAGRVRLWMLAREVDNALEGTLSGEPWAQRDVTIARLLLEH